MGDPLVGALLLKDPTVLSWNPGGRFCYLVLSSSLSEGGEVSCYFVLASHLDGSTSVDRWSQRYIVELAQESFMVTFRRQG